MTRVKRTHRGNETQNATISAPSAGGPLHSFDRVDCMHRVEPGESGVGSSREVSHEQQSELHGENS